MAADGVDDVVGAAFLPTDGQATPSDITQALAKGARHERRHDPRRAWRSLGVEVENGAVRAVVTSAGRVACEKLVICAGNGRAPSAGSPASPCR